MNIVSSTWWMTTAFVFSQHAITTENEGTPTWNQVATHGPSMSPFQDLHEQNPLSRTGPARNAARER